MASQAARSVFNPFTQEDGGNAGGDANGLGYEDAKQQRERGRLMRLMKEKEEAWSVPDEIESQSTSTASSRGGKRSKKKSQGKAPTRRSARISKG